MNGAPRILVVGYNAWDVSVSLAAPPAPDTKLEVPPIRMGGGGPGATAAVALAKLGASVRLLTPLSGDAAGRMQESELAEAGVDIDGCPRHPNHASAMAVILVDPDGGDRTILWARGALPHLEEPADPAVLMAERDLLYVDGHEPIAAASLAAAARDLGLPVVMDAGSVREGSAGLVALCTDVISSRTFATDLEGTPDPVAALRGLRARGPARVALTCGADGVLGLEGDVCFGIPSFEMEVVDTTGAGDVFHAGYAFARARGTGFRDALRFGAATAALKCRDFGGRRALPSVAEVEQLLTGGRERPLAGLVAAHDGHSL